MLALLGAVVAGVLTTLAPCVLPLLPVIVGGSVAGVAGGPDPAATTRPAGGAIAMATRRRIDLATRRLAEEGHFGLAMEAALAALRADLLRESAHRAVIRIHLAEGEPGRGATRLPHLPIRDAARGRRRTVAGTWRLVSLPAHRLNCR